MDESPEDDLPFSEREGIVPRKVIQWQSMDDALRTALQRISPKVIEGEVVRDPQCDG